LAIQVPGEIQSRHLRLASDEYTLSGILFIVFEGSGVHGDGFVA
jgi:hypothetical protein